MVIFVFADFPNRNGIESEIRYDGEDGQVVVDLGVESISSDIQVAREDFDEKYGKERGCHFPGDLREGVGIDFSGGHFLEEFVV